MVNEVPLRDRVRSQTYNSMREQVAIRLKENWSRLRTLLQVSDSVNISEQPPSDEVLLQQADNMIRNRRADFTLSDGSTRTVTLDEFDQKIARLPDAARSMVTSMGRLQDVIPREETLNNIADATTRGVESQSSGFGRIWNFIKGVGAWLMSKFSGHSMTFSEAMASVAAPSVGSSVQEQLQRLAANDADAARLLGQMDNQGRSMADIVAQQAQQGTYTQLGVAPPPQEATAQQPTLAGTRPAATVGLPSNSELQGMIKNRILHPTNAQGAPLTNAQGQSMGLQSVIERLYTDRVNARSNGFALGSVDPRQLLVPGADAIRYTSSQMATIIADTVSHTITDPDFRYNGRKLSELSQEEFATAVSEQTGRALQAREADLGLPRFTSLSDRGDDGKTTLQGIQDMLKQKLMESHAEMRPMLALVASSQARGAMASGTQPQPQPAPLVPGNQGGPNLPQVAQNPNLARPGNAPTV